MKELLTRQIGPLPVWAYGAGLAVGLAAFFFLRGRLNTGASAAIPQTNYAPDQLPYPYPDPGSGAGVPPVPPFDMSSASQGLPVFSNQANFVSPQPQPIGQMGSPDGPSRITGDQNNGAAPQTLGGIAADAGKSIQNSAHKIINNLAGKPPPPAPPPPPPAHQRLGGPQQ